MSQSTKLLLYISKQKIICHISILYKKKRKKIAKQCKFATLQSFRNSNLATQVKNCFRPFCSRHPPLKREIKVSKTEGEGEKFYTNPY